MAAAQEFWKRCEASGDIYKKNYQVKYCVGCELEKQESDLEGGHCPTRWPVASSVARCYRRQPAPR